MKMKRAKVNLNIDINDNFKAGNCKCCPLSYSYQYECYPGAYKKIICCGIKRTPSICPIEIEEPLEDNKVKI